MPFNTPLHTTKHPCACHKSWTPVIHLRHMAHWASGHSMAMFINNNSMAKQRLISTRKGPALVCIGWLIALAELLCCHAACDTHTHAQLCSLIFAADRHMLYACKHAVVAPTLKTQSLKHTRAFNTVCACLLSLQACVSGPKRHGTHLMSDWRPHLRHNGLRECSCLVGAIRQFEQWL